VTKDISGLRLERAAYGVILDAAGCAVDDVIVYPLAEDRFALVVNASMSAAVIAHMRSLPGGGDLRWTDLTGLCGKIDIQGPAAFSIIKPLVADADAVFAAFPYFSFQGDFDFAATKIKLTDGTPILLSRTGYTGEQGFELFLPADKALHLWETLLERGAPSGLIPCGLAARDSLRVGALLPLSHQDIGHWPFINNPWPFALPLDEKGAFTKDFHGRRSLDPASADHTLPFVGYDPRKVDTHDAKVVYNGREIGTVLTAVGEMAIGRVEGRVIGLNSPDKPEGWSPRGLVCGFIKVRERLAMGTVVTLKDSRREIRVEVCTDIRPGRSARKALQTAAR
jgi:aminomethyltransferase